MKREQRIELFLAKIDIAPNGCWIWTASVNRQSGYGQFNTGRTVVRAHRYAYELWVGPIPAGLDLDHECHDPAECAGGPSCPHRPCANPDHLTIATRKRNASPQRSRASAARRAEFATQTHCRNGHELTEANSYRYERNGYQCRSCRTCRSAAAERSANRGVVARG